MTGLIVAMGLVAITLLGLRLGARLPMKDMAAPGAALLLGLAGYAWQGRPSLAGHEVKSTSAFRFDERLAEKRRAIGERMGPASKWLILSDGIARQGNTEDAANVLLSGLKENPKDPDLWVGLGNALLAHNAGRLSPAASHAYREALTLAPQSISASYFYGLALAQSDQFEAAKATWAELAQRLPENADLHAELVRNLGALDQLIAARDAQGAPNGEPGA